MFISALNSIPTVKNYGKIKRKEVTNAEKQVEQQKNNKAFSSNPKSHKPSFGFIDPLILYGILYAGVIGAACYKTSVDEKKRKEEEIRVEAQRRENIQKIADKFNISEDEAIRYHADYMRLAEISSTKDGKEIGLNAVQGYGVEKYKLAVDFVTPVIAKESGNWLYSKNCVVPNGVILYGPPGGGKTYIAEKSCEHIEHFGSHIENLMLTETDHEKNAEMIRKAFDDGKERYQKTGNYTVINFQQDIDNIFIDRNDSKNSIPEITAFLSCAENCAEQGVTWIGTANNPRHIDPAILRPGRADIKMAIGNMEKFAVADMLKYSLIKYDEKPSADEFDYQKVVEHMEETLSVFTPAELELFVKKAKAHKSYPFEKLTANMIIAEMEQYNQYDFPTLNSSLKAKFKDDQDYVKTYDVKKEEPPEEPYRSILEDIPNDDDDDD